MKIENCKSSRNPFFQVKESNRRKNMGKNRIVLSRNPFFQVKESN